MSGKWGISKGNYLYTGFGKYWGETHRNWSEILLTLWVDGGSM